VKKQAMLVLVDRLFGSSRAHGPQLDGQTLLLIRRRREETTC
jgi:hypothetical protein